MKYIFVFILFVLYSRSLFATEAQTFQVSNARAGQISLVSIFAERGKWVVAQFDVLENKLQEKVLEKTFLNEKEAKDFFKKAYPDRTSFRSTAEFVQTELRNQQIWATTEMWTWEWEQKYAEWILTTFNKDFYVTYNIKTDCADAAVAARWIFSRIHGLPAGQSLAATGALFTNESMKAAWENLPTNVNWYEDSLFLRALDYILDNSYTHTLKVDSYPIKITKDTLIPGSHHLQLFGETGHTLLFARYTASGSPIVYYSDIPRAVRKLYVDGYYHDDQPAPGDGGFLKMRWPIRTATRWILMNRADMPFYSMEQYEADFIKPENRYFYKEVHSRLKGHVDIVEEYKAMLESIYDSYVKRVGIVNEGYEFCKTRNCSPGTANYETYSTPNRDGAVLSKVILEKETFENNYQTTSELVQIRNVFLNQTIAIDETTALTIEQIIDVWVNGQYSYDPRDTIHLRWGL